MAGSAWHFRLLHKAELPLTSADTLPKDDIPQFQFQLLSVPHKAGYVKGLLGGLMEANQAA
ncbi:hypothetical protein, partial [Halococcus dombrowskii]|uniref:hypothetical protein n=1 Tax=Halococcus dombrowskii TaxID=179637 RepID=UPI0031D096AE